MADKLLVFNVLSVNEELEKEFNDFFYKYNLLPLFTNEHRAEQITVTDNDLRSVVNTSGKYHKILTEFSNFLTVGTDNKSFEEVMLQLIHRPKSFQGFMNNIKKVMETLKQAISTGHEWNMWNIVWYDKKK